MLSTSSIYCFETEVEPIKYYCKGTSCTDPFLIDRVAMSSSLFPGVERAHRSTSNTNQTHHDEDITRNVTDQFKFMHVSGDTANKNKYEEELARTFMTTLGMNANDATNSDKLEALTKQMSRMWMVKPSGSTSSDQVHNTNQNRGASDSDSGLPSFGMPQIPKAATEVPSSQSPQRNNDSARRGRSPRRPRSRSKTPIGARLKKAVDGIRRSKSPFRRNNKDRSRSPIPMSQKTSSDNMNMATDAEDDEFFETHSSMDSFMANSPIPKPAQKPPKESGSNPTQKRSPTPLTFGRPPLATHNGNSPILSPQKQSTFKFDKEQDKFSVGVSPPKKSKFGSPGKKSRSPPNRSKPMTSPIVQPHRQPDISPLQGSPLSDAGMQSDKSPSPFQSSGGKPQTNSAYPSSQAMDGAPPLFASPVPDLFHAPDTFIRSSGTRGIPSPHNIMQNDPQPDAATRRQTAPPSMGTAASATFTAGSEPKTPFGRSQATPGISETAPGTADTAETLIKKKTRNTATPNLDTTSPIFNVGDLSRNTKATKGKGLRGNTLRKGFNNGYASSKNTGSTGFVFGGLNEIKEVGTDDTAPTATESPSAGSAVSMDTSPFFSPPPQQSQMNAENGMSQGFNAPPQFSLGVAGKLSQPGNHVKFRSKRKDSKGRRGNFQRSQSAQVAGPSGSTFDLNHDRIALEEALSKSRSEIDAFKDRGKESYVAAKYKQSTRFYTSAIEKFKLELFAHVPNKDLLAMLLSNRAAALLMVGAYESAVEDSRNGIHYVTDPRNKNAGSQDANPALRPKLYLRMGRSFLKLGKVDDAEMAFSEAVTSANVIQDFLRRHNIVEIHNVLEQTKTDAIIGRTDVLQLRKLLGKIKRLGGERSVNPKSARDQAMESLGLVKIALSTADGCYELHHIKVTLLAELKRWREVCSHCERFAASNVKFDGCLVGDLSSKNPFPGVPDAKSLRADYFGDTKEDELKGAEMRLDQTASAEALLRLPCSMMPYYLRSLRLNERYSIAENCISKLDKYIRDRVAATKIGASINGQFLWLTEEREKLRRTSYERDLADTLFTNAEYEKAALRYAQCLNIDSGGDQSCTGGRLHAILHCNRAACFMALKRFKEAMTECTAALRIYPRYLKALLRRARCYNRLNRHRETENDFKHWLEIVRHSRESKSNPILGDCVFDGPHTVKEKSIKEVAAELHDFLQARARAEEEEEFARKARNMYKEHKQEQSRKYQEQSRKYHSERFRYESSNKQPFGKKSPAHEDAHRRRENFYSNQDSSRRWDSFKDRTKHSKEEKPKSRKSSQDEFGYKSQRKAPAPAGSPRDNKDHYSVLGINRRATAEEIKKGYKKMALKYHPDKNKDCPTAADNFLRIKDAYEILKEPSSRRKYDSNAHRGRY